MSDEQNINRYKREKANVIIEIGVKNSRQLFNERDPAPFRERDLDPQFVIYLVSAVEEFPLQVLNFFSRYPSFSTGMSRLSFDCTS